MRRFVVVLAALLLLPAPTAAADERPNIILIVTDDQRPNLFDVMPQTRDWFFTGGTRFVEAYASTPLCCPSRASIMSGRYVHNHGVRNNGAWAELDHDQTIQRYLQEAGYRTGLYGKFLNRWDLSLDPPYFDQWGIMAGGYTNWSANVQGIRTRIGTYSTDWIASRAESFMVQHDQTADDQPFFLYLAPYAPHTPFTPAKRHASATVPRFKGNPAVRERDFSDKPPYVQEQAATIDRTLVSVTIPRQQKRTLLSVDQMVARVREAVRQTGELDNTLVVYVSDNGFFWGEHGLPDKRAPYTQAIRVAMMLSWPEQVAAGTSDTRLASLVDVAPTVLDVAGVTPEQPMDGRSLFDPLNDRDRLLTEYFYDSMGSGASLPTWASLRTPSIQYVEYYADETRQEVVFREYYDLVRDPWQLTNLLGDADTSNDPAPATVLALSAQLTADRECIAAACP